MQTCKSASRLPRTVFKQVSSKPITSSTRNNMAFFPRNVYGSDMSFTPLFRLLEDFDTYSKQSGSDGHRLHRTHVPSFSPKFDVREVEDAYELHGELAGLNKNDVHIEFTDPQTLLVRGRVERSYTAGTPPVAAVENTVVAGIITESGEDAAKENNHHATVEDEDDTATTVAAATPATTATDVAETKKESKPVDKAKYWVSERSIGEFSRTFKFPTLVQQDAVSAKLQDGILTLRIPKAKKHETVRINIA
jgi:HSP20 family molecular chaperone IbpA